MDASMNASLTATPPADAGIKLTSFSHGGGCGCKIAPGILSEILKKSSGFPVPKELMVGIETADDAAVYKLNDEQALIATTDFFMPIVDDPFDFGRIAAANAISDVYAMGGTPIMALALVGMPINKLPIDFIGKIIQGGESICAEAGIPVAGGHTIDSVEPIYGLVVMGLVHPSKVKRNADARPGDKLVLGKPLGVGILSAALKKDALDAAGYAAMIENTTKLNKPGLLLLGVQQLAQSGFVTGASGRNWAGYGHDVLLSDTTTPVQQMLLTDPQTSGGLLVACDAATVDSVLEIFRSAGFADAAVIGEMRNGPAKIEVA